MAAGRLYTSTSQRQAFNLPLLTSLPVAGGTGQQLEECTVGWNCSRGLGQARAGGGLHPTQIQPLHSAHAARLAAGMPRPGGRNFLLEDLPEKCQAGSDEERNLDGGR